LLCPLGSEPWLILSLYARRMHALIEAPVMSAWRSHGRRIGGSAVNVGVAIGVLLAQPIGGCLAHRGAWGTLACRNPPQAQSCRGSRSCTARSRRTTCQRRWGRHGRQSARPNVAVHACSAFGPHGYNEAEQEAVDAIVSFIAAHNQPW